jgi:sucrose-6-phosphate hydrolase SacC (GH32 family)
MTLPRELHWRNGAITQALPAEVEKSAAWHRMQIDGAEKAPFVLPAPGLIVIAPVVPSWRLEAHRGDSPIFSLERDAARGLWIFQRGAGSFPAGWARLKEGLEAAFTAPLSAPLGARAGETTIAIDSCSVETFCDGGGVFFAAQVFPADEEWSFKFQPISGTAKFAT